ncbi:hypothetical protein DPMN_112559 [Dreissena polymorpha]|uniref:C1q domain-containing protein n=1 Tax=Dreissena polymorpha TaxID=45954 RepID=A0A9D4KFV7_DREPO|nr:hypothetical protein DPMN_112559 [Dreissena polymorpha]
MWFGVVMCAAILQAHIGPTFALHADVLEQIMNRLELLETENTSLKNKMAELEEKYNTLLEHMNEKKNQVDEKFDAVIEKGPDVMVLDKIQENFKQSEVFVPPKRHAAISGGTKRNVPVQEIAFYATLKSHNISNLGSNQIIVFDNVQYNLGNAYNWRHGFFQAPVDGTYVLHVTLSCRSYTNQALYAFVCVNDVAISELILDTPNQSSQMLVYRLNTGDEVTVTNTNVGDAINGYLKSSFSGFLLYAHGEVTIVG